MKNQNQSKAKGYIPFPGEGNKKKSMQNNSYSENKLEPIQRKYADPEVSEKLQRRKFSIDYKLKILSELDVCTEPGSAGSVLRREGLYFSNVQIWRKQRDNGILSGLSQKPGRKKSLNTPLQEENKKLQKENEQLKKKLKKAEMIIDIQKKISEILVSLGVNQSFSRPNVSNDNPYSESGFKTLKYHSDFADRFGSLEDVLRFCRFFFDWYNKEHHHTGLNLFTPEQVHYGQADSILIQRQNILNEAFKLHPERFVKGCPTHPPLPDAVWINEPKKMLDIEEDL